MKSAPLHSDLAEGPEGGAAVWLHADDGVRLRMAYWPEGPRGAVMLFPGRTEMIEKYGRTAARLARRGFGLFVIDWRGQGLSDRLADDPLLGHVGSFDDYQRDVAAYRTAIEHIRGKSTPLYVLAHSMGGNIALRALIEGLPARAVAFSAPMWGLALTATIRHGLELLSAAGRATGMDMHPVPGAGREFRLWENPFDENVLTSDAETYAWMQAQVIACPELRLGPPSLRWIGLALAECRALAAQPSPALPAFCAYGSREKVVEPDAIEARMADWPDSRLEHFDGAEHELLMETPPRREAFLDALTAHFRAH